MTCFFYDAGGNPVKTVDPTGNATEAGYDPAGRMMNATDALGEVTRFTYDSQGRPASRTDPFFLDGQGPLQDLALWLSDTSH